MQWLTEKSIGKLLAFLVLFSPIHFQERESWERKRESKHKVVSLAQAPYIYTYRPTYIHAPIQWARPDFPARIEFVHFLISLMDGWRSLRIMHTTCSIHSFILSFFLSFHCLKGGLKQSCLPCIPPRLSSM